MIDPGNNTTAFSAANIKRFMEQSAKYIFHIDYTKHCFHEEISCEQFCDLLEGFMKFSRHCSRGMGYYSSLQRLFSGTAEEYHELNVYVTPGEFASDLMS